MTQDLHWNTPLISRSRADDGGEEEPVLRLIAPGPAGEDSGAAWHYCGIGIKNQP
jgi:hypothetical protein